MHLRLLLLLVLALAVAATLVGSAAAGGDVEVSVRVEGKTRTLFGSTEPTLVPAQGTVAAEGEGTLELSAPTALGALEAASLVGEFNYNLKLFSFGSFVDRVGRFGSQGVTGWLFKVNGKAVDVGASDAILEDGDVVLWYWAKLNPQTFAGPNTLNLIRKRGCLIAQSVNASGKAKRAKNVVFKLDEKRRVRSRSGRICTSNYETVQVVKRGLTRSQVLGQA